MVEIKNACLGKQAQEIKLADSLLSGKRKLTQNEISILVKNGNTCSDDWQNFYVSEKKGEFDPSLIFCSDFEGYIVLGRLTASKLKYHDLELECGIYRSALRNVVTGNDCVVRNVAYLDNYRLGNLVMLFNIQEMSCTCHSKFGEGILKDGESEDNRIWIGVGNENDGRKILPFEDMIPADAFLWSRYREDRVLMNRFVELTEFGKSKALDTYGTVGNETIIKNCNILKDVKVGDCAYIKGAFKIKNVTVLSSEKEPSQIGEGVEMVNGIMGFGSKVFYQAVAVRFIIGRNCQLKYGARLLNSVLGDNSTVSCCELLNNLIFPFHEQHHNSSFLIASTVMGQSNIASAATIGSNHNSRSPDCEMIAGRGFWPGLCSDFKFDSKFASFTLISKGSYQNELNITYPFSLVAQTPGDCAVHIIPAYWFLYNMFAIVRNKYKFVSRDKRVNKVQHIETNPLAPDTIQEVLSAIDRIIELTANYLKLSSEECDRVTEYKGDEKLLEESRRKAMNSRDFAELRQIAKDYLHQNSDSKFRLSDDRCQKKFGAVICKPAQAYKEYRRILKYFAAESLMEWVFRNNKDALSPEDIEKIESTPLYTEFINAGGQILPVKKVDELFESIKNFNVESWQQVHDFYDLCQKEYLDVKAHYSIYVLEKLYSKSIRDFTEDDFEDFSQDVAFISMNMLESSISAREKDFTDYFRSITFRNQAEKDAVLGTLEDDSFLKKLRGATEEFIAQLDKLLINLK